MRVVAIVISILMCWSVSAQLIVKPLQSHTNKAPTGQRIEDIQQASLPFWDDFSITSSNTPDSIRVWGTDTTTQWDFEASKDVLVNATLARNPPSYRVVTFDGLKSDGTFHGDGRGLTDQLVSDSIDLSTYNEQDDIYLSFYWQAGGNVEKPESGDSLVLQFFDPLSASQWQTVWSMDGEDVMYDSIFYQEAIQVTQSYLTNRFRFRFQSYGDQNGPFDAWHVDWIYMNEGRENEDYFYLDRGFTGQLTSPFLPFKALPINQFKVNQLVFTGPQEVQVFNLDQFIQPTEYIIVLRDLVNNIRIDSIQYGSENPLLPNIDPFILALERFITYDGIALSQIPNQDSIVLQSELYIESSDDDFLDGTQIDLRINDTLRAEYLLHDFYAYDDGTAEYAVGNNVRGGKVGVQYWVEEQDTLTHIDFYFPNIAPSSSGASLTLRIFKDLNDEFAMRSQSISVENGSSINGFTRYTLNRPLIVSDTFFITYEQNVNEYVGVGFDRSNMAASPYIFDNIGEEWRRNDRLKGALMIRPIFKPVPDYTLGAEEAIESLVIYPNPTKGDFEIMGDYESIRVFSISGQLMMEQDYGQKHSLEKFPSGLYLLSIHRKEGNQTQKIYKK